VFGGDPREARPERAHRRRVSAGLVLALCTGVSAGSAEAQAAKAPAPTRIPGPARFEASGGVSWLGGYDLGSRDATLTGNAGTPGGEAVLFQTEADITSTVGIDVRVGVRVTRRLVTDAIFGYAQPDVRVKISGDFEQAADVTLTDSVSQFVIGGELRYHFADVTGGRGAVVPFVSGGAAYLRQLASDATAVESGTLVSGGGGVVWQLGGNARGTLRGYGVRADARLNWRTSGIDVEEASRVFPSLGAGMFVRF
jgi:hypothetical protein